MENKSDHIKKNLKNKLIQKEEFNVKESQCYNVSVPLKHLQDVERRISNEVKSPKSIGDLMILDEGSFELKRYSFDFILISPLWITLFLNISLSLSLFIYIYIYILYIYIYIYIEREREREI